ncbi:MAG: hypothetical protein ACRDHO_01640 [Actinomycetota bacterium]
MTPSARLRLGTSLLAAALTLGACVGSAGEPVASKPPRAPTPANPAPTPTSTPAESTEGLLLASSFEEPVCGLWTGQPEQRGCEFGVQGGAEAGPYGSRTGDWAARIQRMTPSHQGVIANAPLADGHGFIGVAHRIPAIPPGAIPAFPGHIQLEQLSPTDGILPGWPLEVRLYPDRRLGLALFQERHEVAIVDWRVPVDEWFYVVVEIANGARAQQRMWLYGPRGSLQAKVSIRLNTRQRWPHATRTAHKIGGNTSTLVPMYTYADDWYISETFLGPVRIDEQGSPSSP